ncbi:MAG: hypothetical protein RLZZ156_949 [Deinococcota bacterium]|jgi:hypothetical protein
MNRIALAFAAVVVGGIALAAPALRLTSSALQNGRVSGEVVNIAAYTQLPILTRSNSGKSVVLVYKGKDAAEPFKFHEAAFEKQGWKINHMGGGDAMMGGAMDKPADGAMTGGAMDKPGGAMDKPAGAMDKPADAMGGTMMDKGLEASLTFKSFTLSLKSSLVGTDQIKVSFDLK